MKIKAVLLGLWLLLGIALPYEGDYTLRDFATRLFGWSGVNGVPGYNTDPTRVLGFPPPNSTPAVPDNSKVFSFGWGGFVEVGFDRPIRNIPPSVDPKNPNGFELIVFGNAFYVGGNPCHAYVEPGYVEVGVDVNGNGIPDGEDRWYLLLSPRPDPRDQNGIPRFPLSDSYFGPHDVCADLVIGYADVTPIDNRGNPLIPDDPNQPGIQSGSAGGDTFDLDWAVDAQTGQGVHLEVVHFVRIGHAGNANLGPFGRSSTEVSAIALIRLPGDVDGNGCVDDTDLSQVLSDFGSTGQSLPSDLNRDGGVDAADLSIVLVGFGCD